MLVCVQFSIYPTAVFSIIQYDVWLGRVELSLLTLLIERPLDLVYDGRVRSVLRNRKQSQDAQGMYIRETDVERLM